MRCQGTPTVGATPAARFFAAGPALARLAANNAEKAHSGVVLLSLLQQRRVFELEVYQPAEVGTPQHDQQRGVEGDGGMHLRADR